MSAEQSLAFALAKLDSMRRLAAEALSIMTDEQIAELRHRMDSLERGSGT